MSALDLKRFRASVLVMATPVLPLQFSLWAMASSVDEKTFQAPHPPFHKKKCLSAAVHTQDTLAQLSVCVHHILLHKYTSVLAQAWAYSTQRTPSLCTVISRTTQVHTTQHMASHIQTQDSICTPNTSKPIFTRTQNTITSTSIPTHCGGRQASTWPTAPPPPLRYRGLEHTPKGQTLQETVHDVPPGHIQETHVPM